MSQAGEKGRKVIVKPTKWKSVAIESFDINGIAEDVNSLEGLVSFEELVDYNVSTVGGGKKRKRGKRAANDDFDGDDDDHANESGYNGKRGENAKRGENGKKMKVSKESKKNKRELKKRKGSGEKTKNEKKVDQIKSPKKVVTKASPPVSRVPVPIDSHSGEKDETYFKPKSSAWDNLFIPDCVMRALHELKFEGPTPIQAQAIPAAIRDRLDILGAAETGSGKTLAFAIPLIHFVLKEKESEKAVNEGSVERKIRALVLTPTRELAVQIRKHVEAVTKYSDVSVGVVVGGMSVQKQERILRKHCPDILVATPGRLWELIESNNENLNVNVIKRLNKFVIDEADRMTEKGHFEELSRITDLLKENPVKGRQIFVFSATLTLIHQLPKRVRLKKRKNKANEITQSGKLEALIEMIGMREKHTRVIDLTRQGIGMPAEQMLTEVKINCLTEEKDLYLYYFLTLYHGRTLIFCNSKDCLRRLQNVFKLLQLNPLVLHASIPQKRRLTNLERFESNPRGVLIASDVAARGLDIANVDHVIHYQIPRTAEIYIHRSGRTARAFNEGLSLMLCDPKEETFLYRKLCQTMNKGNDLQLFPIDQSILKTMKQRVSLAQKVDQLEHKVRKSKANNDWFRHAADQCEIEIDEQLIGGKDEKETQLERKQLKSMTLQLNALLKKPIVSRNQVAVPSIASFAKKNAIQSTSFKGQTALVAAKERRSQLASN